MTLPVAFGARSLSAGVRRTRFRLWSSNLVTARQPSPSAQLAALLSRFSPEIVALARRCLPKLRRAIPCSYQLVYDYPHSLVVAFSMSERGYEAIVAIAILPRGLQLYFDKSLPDPKGLLEGSGTKVRSVSIKAASDLDHADIQALFKAAIKRSGDTFPPTRATRMVIKSKSKQRLGAGHAAARGHRRLLPS